MAIRNSLWQSELLLPEITFACMSLTVSRAAANRSGHSSGAADDRIRAHARAGGQVRAAARRGGDLRQLLDAGRDDTGDREPRVGVARGQEQRAADLEDPRSFTPTLALKPVFQRQAVTLQA